MPGRGTRSTAALAAALLMAATALGVVAARGPQPPVGMDERVHAVAETLRCPVCQNLSVADSPSTLAGEMRRTIARRLEAGRTPQEIRAEFVAAYGEWILQAPPPRGINLVAWAAPAVLLLAGLVTAGVALQRWTARPSRRDLPGADGRGPAPLSAADRRLLDRALAGAPEDPQ